MKKIMLENMEELSLLRDNIYKNYDVIREKDKNILKDIKTVNKINGFNSLLFAFIIQLASFALIILLIAKWEMVSIDTLLTQEYLYANWLSLLGGFFLVSIGVKLVSIVINVLAMRIPLINALKIIGLVILFIYLAFQVKLLLYAICIALALLIISSIMLVTLSMKNIEKLKVVLKNTDEKIKSYFTPHRLAKKSVMSEILKDVQIKDVSSVNLVYSSVRKEDETKSTVKEKYALFIMKKDKETEVVIFHKNEINKVELEKEMRKIINEDKDNLVSNIARKMNDLLKDMSK